MNKGVGAAVLVATVFFLVFVKKIANSIGADFEVTLEAITFSGLIVIIAGIALAFLKPRITVSLAILGTLIWPAWWRVLDSIAAGGKNPSADVIFMLSTPWWDTSLFKWGVELTLAAIATWLLVKDSDWG